MKRIAIMLVSALMVISACTKDEDDAAENKPVTVVPDGPFKASYSLDGRAVSFADGSSGYITPSAVMAKNLVIHPGPDGPDTTLVITASYSVNLQAKGAFERLSITTDTLRFIDSVNYNSLRPRADDFYFFVSGPKAHQGGLMITYIAPDSSKWTSDGAQTENVNFTRTGAGLLENGIEYAKTTITFNNIVLYKSGTPASTKTLTGGNITAFIINSK